MNALNGRRFLFVALSAVTLFVLSILFVRPSYAELRATLLDIDANPTNPSAGDNLSVR